MGAARPAPIRAKKILPKGRKLAFYSWNRSEDFFFLLFDSQSGNRSESLDIRPPSRNPGYATDLNQLIIKRLMSNVSNIMRAFGRFSSEFFKVLNFQVRIFPHFGPNREARTCCVGVTELKSNVQSVFMPSNSFEVCPTLSFNTTGLYISSFYSPINTPIAMLLCLQRPILTLTSVGAGTTDLLDRSCCYRKSGFCAL